mmetsp:Transcript_5007/g.21484  ORF Transcript_5007/g.21484 Transcript_5007/m.21484 type:complete len:326 (-) Transcript_5007:3059-4036(-)
MNRIAPLGTDSTSEGSSSALGWPAASPSTAPPLFLRAASTSTTSCSAASAERRAVWAAMAALLPVALAPASSSARVGRVSATWAARARSMASLGVAKRSWWHASLSSMRSPRPDERATSRMNRWKESRVTRQRSGRSSASTAKRACSLARPVMQRPPTMAAAIPVASSAASVSVAEAEATSWSGLEADAAPAPSSSGHRAASRSSAACLTVRPAAGTGRTVLARRPSDSTMASAAGSTETAVRVNSGHASRTWYTSGRAVRSWPRGRPTRRASPAAAVKACSEASAGREARTRLSAMESKRALCIVSAMGKRTRVSASAAGVGTR